MEHIFAGFYLFIQPSVLLATFFGVFLGTVMGSIPGLTATMAIALIIPMTFYLSPIVSIGMLVGAYKGGCYGGSIPAILLNTPGTPAAAATVLDGYPMARKGKALKALKMAIYASVMADSFSDIVLILISPPLALIALKMGPPEMASLIIFSLLIITLVAGKSMIKGLIAGVIGLIIGNVGLDPILASRRLTFGMYELDEGVALIPMLIGLFAVSEFFIHAAKKITSGKLKLYENSQNPDDNRVTALEMKSSLKIIGLASVIGTVLGAIPGIGPSISAYVSYGQAKRISKNPERFGEGAIEGVAAAEAGNNAVAGANLIPLLTLGIPGDLTAAVLLGAFMIQGLHPGPLLFKEHIDIIYAIFMSLLFANFCNFLIGTQYIKLASKVANIPKSIIFPSILVFCVVGSFATNQNPFDVWVMMFFGIIGFVMRRYDFPLAPLLIAFILEPMLETSFRQSLLMSAGSMKIFLDHPISFFILIMSVIFLFFIIKSNVKHKIKIFNFKKYN
jgi:putative tricarboxylic transport membrane protein